MNNEVDLLLKARDATFRSGHPEAYKNSDPHHMWQGIKLITRYKSPRSPLSYPTLPHSSILGLTERTKPAAAESLPHLTTNH